MNEITPLTLRRLMENDETLNEVRVFPQFIEDPRMDQYNKFRRISDVFPRGYAGWKNAGEIIGSNTSLCDLNICCGVGNYGDAEQNLKVFFGGINRNQSIERLGFRGWDPITRTRWDACEGAPFLFMVPLLQSNCNLKMLCISHCRIGNTGVSLLASALSSCISHRLERIELHACSILDDESFEDLVEALTPNHEQQPTLTELDMGRNKIGMNGCASLASMLSNPNCQLRALNLNYNCIDDCGIIPFAEVLAKNNTLEQLFIAQGNKITNHGWDTLSRALCNIDTINDTYLSNHKVLNLGQTGHFRHQNVELPSDLESSLRLNFNSDFAPIQKILCHHHDWNMSLLIEEDLRFLPIILRWIDVGSVLNQNIAENTSLSRRQAAALRRRNDITLKVRRNSTILQFVRSMPLIVIDKLRANGM